MKRRTIELATAAVAAAAMLGTRAAGPGPDKPDVTSRGGLRIGSVLIPWGNAAPADLKGADAVQSGGQACAFHATYDMTNLGGAATSPPFTNRLRVDGAGVVATSFALSLAARETKSITTSPYLPVGSHSIELALDDDSVVAESRKDNNRFRVLYVLKAPCGAAAPTRPPAPAPAGK
ncbi:MAG: CARDB domain-containing protein [Thermoanaerobaculia bacterium]|jgi:hypothetical protein